MKVRRIKWVTVTVVQVGEEVKVMIGFGKLHHPVGDVLIRCDSGELVRVIHNQPIKVIE